MCFLFPLDIVLVNSTRKHEHERTFEKTMKKMTLHGTIIVIIIIIIIIIIKKNFIELNSIPIYNYTT